MLRKSPLVLIFKLIVLLGIIGQSVYIWFYQPTLIERIIRVVQDGIDVPVFLFVLLLMIFNWSLESMKWQFMIREITKITFFKSLKTILLGLAFGFFTPRGVGEYFARVYVLEEKRKLPLVLSLVVARTSQLLTIILGGGVGFFIVKDSIVVFDRVFDPFNLWMGILGAFLVLVVVLVAFFHFRIKAYKIVHALKQFSLLSSRVLLEAMSYSLIRYLVYCSQFVLLVYALGDKESFLPVFGAVMLTFLLKAAIPVFNFMSDIGVRELFAVFFLSLVGVESEVSLASSILLWLINIVIPTFLGGMLVFKTKIVW